MTDHERQRTGAATNSGGMAWLSYKQTSNGEAFLGKAMICEGGEKNRFAKEQRRIDMKGNGRALNSNAKA